jgi:ADP-heptose:LPS heptosyltransferase/GT2 family glycosyltransferase
VSADRRVDEVSLIIGGKALCRITYGLVSEATLSADSGAQEYQFAFNPSRPAIEAASPLDFTIVAQMQDGTVERESFTVLLQSIANPLATIVAGPTRLSVSPQDALAPLALYVETATVDAEERFWATGWILSEAPIVAIQFFSGDDRIGAAQLNKPREDVARVHSRYPNAATSGFTFSSVTGAIERNVSDVRVQALNVRGFSYEAAILLEQRDNASLLIPPSAPETSRPPTPQAGDHVDRRAIRVHCDEVRLSQDGHLVVSGWAFCQVGISRMEVRVDGELVGVPDVGLPRPDVAEEHGDNPMARFSGFRFAQEIGPQATTQHEVELAVYNGLDDKRSETRALYPSSIQETAAQPNPEEVPGIRLRVDRPTIENGAVKRPVSGMLTIEGWCLAETEIREVEVFVDDVRMGKAHYGLSRRDVAAVFPSAERAARSGYVHLCPLRGLEPGAHIVKVRATLVDGKTAVRQFTIEVEHDENIKRYSQIHERIHPAKLAIYKSFFENRDQLPAFMVVLRHSAGAGREQLEETLDSLRRQTYENWRLIVIVTNAKIRSIVQELTQGMDKTFADRIEFVTAKRVQAQGAMPSSAAREGRRKKAPTFYSFLCPGDRLSCEALSEVALLSLRHPETDVIYADESRISPASGDRDAFFKPDWSPDLLLSTNYIGRPWFVAETLLRRSNSAPHLLSGHGEYDCVLKCVEHASSIRHIAKLLCHRGSADLDAPEVEQKALSSAVRRRGLQAEIVPGHVRGMWRIRRAVKSEELVSIIIPTCAANGYVKTCIETLRSKTSYRNFEIISVDNVPDSQPEWKTWLRQASDRVVEIPEPFNWSRFNNVAVSHAQGKFVLFLNDDIEIIQSDWVEAMLEHAQRPEVGIVGPQLVYPDRRVQHAGMFLSTAGIARHAFRMLREADPGYFGLALAQRNVIAVTGACMLVRREDFARLGGFDEAHQVINNDLDYCLRAHAAGQLTVFTPYAKLIHHELGSRDRLEDVYDSTRFMSKWKTIFAQGDPYFNPRLSIHADDYRPDDEPAQEIYAGPAVDRVKDVRSILAVKLDHIGDFITAIPAIRKLKTLFPGAALYILATKAARSLAEFVDGVDGFIEFEFFHARSELGHLELTEGDFEDLARRLEPYHFDLAVDFRRHVDTRKVLEYVPARIRAGYDHKGQFPFLDIALEWEEDTPLRRKRAHTSQGLLNLVEAIGTALSPVLDRAQLVYAEGNDALARLPAHARGLFNKPVAAIHPGAGNVTKQWPVAHFASLVDLLVEKSGLNIVLIGSPDERPLTEDILSLIANKEAVISLAGEISLKDLPQLLQACRLFVGNDSGPKHIAGAMGIPTIGIHSGVVDAAEWGPLGPRTFALRRQMFCTPCYLLRATDCPRAMACLKQLEPATVHQYADALLAVTGRPQDAGKAGSPRRTKPSAMAPVLAIATQNE